MVEAKNLTFDEFAAFLHRRSGQDEDNVVAIDGYEGSGKSTLAIQLARAIQRLQGTDFPPEHTIFDWSQWDEVFSFRDKRQVYILDEGGNLALSRDAMTGGNKEMVRILTQARQLNHTIIFCMPSFYWLDKYVREHRVKWWLHVEKRGEATLLERYNDWRRGETWFEDCNARFNFDDLAVLDPPYWAKYVAHKREAFVGKYDSKIVEDVGDPIISFDNLQGITGRKQKRKVRKNVVPA